MRYTLLITTICCVAILVNGQRSLAESNGNRETTNRTQVPTYAANNTDTGTVNKLPEQGYASDKAPQQPDKSASYFDRLIAPENLPNLILCVVGAAGVIAAICTLRAIRRQSDIMGKQLAVPYRAYLEIVEPEKPVGNHAEFPIINTGRVLARILSIDVELIIHNPSEKELFRSSINKKIGDGKIPPEKGSSYALNVYWPDVQGITDSIIMSVAVT